MDAHQRWKRNGRNIEYVLRIENDDASCIIIVVGLDIDSSLPLDARGPMSISMRTLDDDTS